jgi:hypothetical protein
MNDTDVTISLKEINDDDLRRLLFDRVVEKLDAEQLRHPFLKVQNRAPYLFSLQRSDGCVLAIDRCDPSVLMRGQIFGRPWLNQQPSKFNVVRSPDGGRLHMPPDREGSIDDIAENIVRTFLDRGEFSTGRSDQRPSTTTAASL